MYSFDISYPITKDVDATSLKKDVMNIVTKYFSCKKYSEDVTPYGRMHSQRYYNFGFFIGSNEELCNLIIQVGNHPQLFINLINYYRTPEDMNPIRIYTSVTETRFMSPNTKRRYHQNISNLANSELEIFELANKNSKKNTSKCESKI
jgi:hypothetical protein